MAEDFAELMLEGASAGINHYEKIVDPLKKHVKRIASSRSRQRNERYRYTSDESDDDDDDGRPRRRYDDRYTPSSRSDPDHRSGGGEPVRVVEEYERIRGRRLSTGGDPHYGKTADPRCMYMEKDSFFIFSFHLVLFKPWQLISACRRSL